MSIFSSVPIVYSGMGSPTGLHYEAMKDTITWMGLKPKDMVPLLNQCFSHYLKGHNLKSK